VIHSAPKWQRGKIARAVASKVAIAARIDVYRRANKDLSILDRLNTRIAEIQVKNKDPISEKERNRKYREHEQRQQRQQLATLKKDKRIKNRKKYGKRFGKRQY
jgi:nucleolar protein 56